LGLRRRSGYLPVLVLGLLPMLEPLVLLLGLDELLLGLELDEPELMPPELEEPEPVWLELEPLAPPCSFFSWACHSDLLICPSWLVSILSNSSLPELEAPDEALDGELDDEPELDGELDEPPAADDDLPLDDDVPPVEDEPLDDGVLLCDMDGELLEPELDLDFESSA
jgi:hypothetical protein